MVNQYEVDPSPATIRNLGSELSAFFQAFDEFMVRYTLEEATIEAVLGPIYEDGRLSYVAKNGHINGGYYLRESAKTYESKMGELIKEVETGIKKLRIRNHEVDSAIDS